MRTASHFAIILHQCNPFCHPALSQRPARDPCFTLKLGSNRAEGLSRERRQLSHSCSVLPLFHVGNDRKIQYAECTPIPGLPENVGAVLMLRTMHATVLSLPDREQKAGWDLKLQLFLLFPRGRAAAQSLAASLPTGAMGKPAYWLFQLLCSPAGWSTSFVCVKQQLHRSPRYRHHHCNSTHGCNGGNTKRGRPPAAEPPCCWAAHLLHSQHIWKKSGVTATWPQQCSHTQSCPASQNWRVCPHSFFPSLPGRIHVSW